MTTGTSEQIALFDVISVLTPRYPILAYVYHTPNGEMRDKATAAKLSRMGVKRGVPDILFPYAAKGYVGIAIEMKSLQESVSDDQLRWMRHYGQQGWLVSICYTAKQAYTIVASYCDIPVDIALFD